MEHYKLYLQHLLHNIPIVCLTLMYLRKNKFSAIKLYPYLKYPQRMLLNLFFLIQFSIECMETEERCDVMNNDKLCHYCITLKALINLLCNVRQNVTQAYFRCELTCYSQSSSASKLKFLQSYTYILLTTSQSCFKLY